MPHWLAAEDRVDCILCNQVRFLHEEWLNCVMKGQLGSSVGTVFTQCARSPGFESWSAIKHRYQFIISILTCPKFVKLHNDIISLKT